MARLFVKGTLQLTSIDENKKKERVSLGHVVANLQQIATVRWLFLTSPCHLANCHIE